MSWKRNLLRAVGLAIVVSGVAFLCMSDGQWPQAEVETAQAEVRTGDGPSLAAVMVRLESLHAEVIALRESDDESDVDRTVSVVNDLRHEQHALARKLAAVEAALVREAPPCNTSDEIQGQMAALKAQLEGIDGATSTLSGQVERLQQLASVALAATIPDRDDDPDRQSQMASLHRQIRVSEAELQRRVLAAEDQQRAMHDPHMRDRRSTLEIGLERLNRRVEQQRTVVDALRAQLSGLEEGPRVTKLRALLSE